MDGADGGIAVAIATAMLDLAAAVAPAGSATGIAFAPARHLHAASSGAGCGSSRTGTCAKLIGSSPADVHDRTQRSRRRAPGRCRACRSQARDSCMAARGRSAPYAARASSSGGIRSQASASTCSAATIPVSPLQSSDAASVRDQSSRAQRRTPTLATGRKHSSATSVAAADPDASFVAIAIVRCPPARGEKESSRWPTPRDRIPSGAITPRCEAR